MPYLKDEWRVPGIFIRDSLYELGRASCSQVHRLYRGRIRDENLVRPKKQRISGMTYPSMLRYFHLLKDAGAIEITAMEPVREELAHLRRFTLEGAEPAMQVLYKPIAAVESPIWIKPWMLK